MRLRLALRDELLAHADRKRQVREMMAVEVTELPAADEELDAAESVRRHRHAIPPGDFVARFVL